MLVERLHYSQSLAGTSSTLYDIGGMVSCFAIQSMYHYQCEKMH